MEIGWCRLIDAKVVATPIYKSPSEKFSNHWTIQRVCYYVRVSTISFYVLKCYHSEHRKKKSLLAGIFFDSFPNVTQSSRHYFLVNESGLKGALFHDAEHPKLLHEVPFPIFGFVLEKRNQHFYARKKVFFTFSFKVRIFSFVHILKNVTFHCFGKR